MPIEFNFKRDPVYGGIFSRRPDVNPGFNPDAISPTNLPFDPSSATGKRLNAQYMQTLAESRLRDLHALRMEDIRNREAMQRLQAGIGGEKELANIRGQNNLDQITTTGSENRTTQASAAELNQKARQAEWSREDQKDRDKAIKLGRAVIEAETKTPAVSDDEAAQVGNLYSQSGNILTGKSNLENLSTVPREVQLRMKTLENQTKQSGMFNVGPSGSIDLDKGSKTAPGGSVKNPIMGQFKDKNGNPVQIPIGEQQSFIAPLEIPSKQDLFNKYGPIARIDEFPGNVIPDLGTNSPRAENEGKPTKPAEVKENKITFGGGAMANPALGYNLPPPPSEHNWEQFYHQNALATVAAPTLGYKPQQLGSSPFVKSPEVQLRNNPNMMNQFNKLPDDVKSRLLREAVMLRSTNSQPVMPFFDWSFNR